MRVGLSIETDAPGGAETMLLQLARELLSRGHEVVALGTVGGSDATHFAEGETGWLTARFAEMGVGRELVRSRGPFGLGSVPRIASVIRAHRLDVLHSHEFSMSVLGAAAARLARCPHVITMHGGVYYASAPRRRLAMRRAAAWSRHTVAVSEASRRSFAEALGVPVGTIELVHNGVAPVAGAGGAIRAELRLAPEDVLVLAVGSLLPVKGHAVLLEALARLEDVPARVVVAIAGRGEQEDGLRRLAGSLGVEERVHLLGYRADIADLLAGADVFAMPSRSEGLPMAMIEAMLAGRAVVASDVGGMRELVPGADVGLLVPAGDPSALAASLARLAREGALRERLGAAAAARARERFTAAAMADRYLALYGHPPARSGT